MKFDVSKLSMGEVAKVEELSGQSIATVSDADSPKGLALAALAFVAKRREDPNFSWNDAQALTFGDVNEILELSDTPDVDDEDDADPLAPSAGE